MSRYPSEVELRAIENWDSRDLRGLVLYVKSIWSSYGRIEIKGKRVLTVTFITGGWSGNEDILQSLNSNIAFRLCWQVSKRGGWHQYKVRQM